MSHPVVIKTPRVELAQITTAHVVAWRAGPGEFQRLFGLTVADDLADFWEGYEKLLSKLTVPPDEWLLGYQVILPPERKVIGGCGYKGPPLDDGSIEIAYITAPAYRGQGYATEAAQALIRYAFGFPGITVVCAHTLPEKNASARILTKCGLRNLGEVTDPEDGRLWRWEIERDEFHAQR